MLVGDTLPLRCLAPFGPIASISPFASLRPFAPFLPLTLLGRVMCDHALTRCPLARHDL
jgi:hypothetical protein